VKNLQYLAQHGLVAHHDRHHHGRRALAVDVPQVALVLVEQLDHVRVRSFDGDEERRPSVVRRRVDVSAALEEERRDEQVATLARGEERGDAARVGLVDIDPLEGPE